MDNPKQRVTPDCHRAERFSIVGAASLITALLAASAIL
jgi:hypothetical protein